MDNKEVFKIWAPYGKKWVDWVKPPVFINIGNNEKEYEYVNYNIPNIKYVNDDFEKCAIIVDIYGGDAIREGIALAKLGYRPIPIFNGTNPPLNAKALVNNFTIEQLLLWGAMYLKKIKIKDSAPPVFLLDVNRLNIHKVSKSIFDNSWDIYEQDIPSSNYFLKNGIDKIIVRSDKINRDLKKILFKYQKNGIKIFITNGYEEPKKIVIKNSRN